MSRAAPMTGSPSRAAAETTQSEQRLERLIDRLPQGMQRAVRRLRRPEMRWLRIPAGMLLAAASLLSILPLFGIWMLPLGLVLLADDVALLRRGRDRLLAWAEWRWPHWF